jgi:hypothetical protein
MGGFDAGRFFDVYADILLNGLRAAPEVKP